MKFIKPILSAHGNANVPDVIGRRVLFNYKPDGMFHIGTVCSYVGNINAPSIEDEDNLVVPGDITCWIYTTDIEVNRE